MNQDFWPLRTAARNYYDAYRLTTRIGNRLRALARAGEAYDIDLDAQLKVALEMKKDEQRILTRIYRNTAPPALRSFQAGTLGIGEVWMARLIGEVGDMKTYREAWWEEGAATAQLELEDIVVDDFADDDSDDDDAEVAAGPPPKRVLMIGEVRTTGVRELWAYCGHGDPALRRRRGQSQDEALASGNPTAKMVLHQMAEFALRSNGVPDKNGKPRGCTPYYLASKPGNAYPLTYLSARKAAEAAHPDWKPGHVYNHAVRLVGKAMLKDFWRVQHDQEPVFGARTEWSGPRRATHIDIGRPVRNRVPVASR